jgi:hypothetical protein
LKRRLTQDLSFLWAFGKSWQKDRHERVRQMIAGEFRQ